MSGDYQFRIHPELDTEQRISIAVAAERARAEGEATKVIARIVAAAGGEVVVPDKLAVEDVTMYVDFSLQGTVYRAVTR